MLLWVTILFWTSWRKNIPLHPPLLTLSFFHQKLDIRWYLKDSVEQLFVTPASKFKGQQVCLVLILLAGGACAPPSSLLQLIYVVPFNFFCCPADSCILRRDESSYHFKGHFIHGKDRYFQVSRQSSTVCWTGSWLWGCCLCYTKPFPFFLRPGCAFDWYFQHLQFFESACVFA